MDETLSTSPNVVPVSRTEAKGPGKIYNLAAAPKSIQEIECDQALTPCSRHEALHFTTTFTYGYCT
jgi:hypothetical protein